MENNKLSETIAELRKKPLSALEYTYKTMRDRVLRGESLAVVGAEFGYRRAEMSVLFRFDSKVQEMRRLGATDDGLPVTQFWTKGQKKVKHDSEELGLDPAIVVYRVRNKNLDSCPTVDQICRAFRISAPEFYRQLKLAGPTPRDEALRYKAAMLPGYKLEPCTSKAKKLLQVHSDAAMVLCKLEPLKTLMAQDKASKAGRKWVSKPV